MKRSQYMNYVIWIMTHCSIVLLFLQALLPPNHILVLVFDCFIVCSFGLHIWFTKCPHCGRRGLRLRLYRDDRGYCSHCGELAEFEE